MSERGASALLIAAAAVFLIGAAALAIDVSGFYQTAASEQRAADLGCLAGSAELPGDPAGAFREAASFARPNHPQLASIDPTSPTQVIAAVPPTTGEVRRWTVGDTTLEIETPVLYGGTFSETTLRVSIVQGDETAFGKVIGADNVDIGQEAYCGVFSSLPAGIFPVGVTGGFGGGVVKFDDSQCNDEASTTSGSGVCNYLDIPRDAFDYGSGTTNLVYNMMLGSDWPLTCYEPSGAGGCLSTIVDCVDSTPPVECNRLISKSGNVPNAIYQGLIGGRVPTNHLGLLAYSAGAISAPANPHEKPTSGTSSIALPTSPTSLIDWNTNYLTNPGLHSVTCTPGSGNAYYDASFLGGPAEPSGSCDATDIDDQPDYSTSPTSYTYEAPPSFSISEYDCRDRRLIVLPAGTWGPPNTTLPSNPRNFTITGFELGYIVDPIYEDEGGTAGVVDSTDHTTYDNRMLHWEDSGSPGWDVVSATATSVEQMSILSVSFTSDAVITGNCDLTPFDPALEGLTPKQVSLVDAP